MSGNTKYKGKVKEGLFSPYFPNTYHRRLDELEGKEVNVIVQEARENTTEDQYAYYRSAIVRNACKKGSEIFGGWTEEEIHTYFCQEFLTTTKILLTDDSAEEIRITSSTSKIGKKKMIHFIEQVIQWCAEHEIVIQDPDQYYADQRKYIIDRRG